MAYKYTGNTALGALVEKITTLVNAVKETATNALSAAQTASAEAKFYGTCNTAAATVAKVVTCSAFKTLTAGSRISVKFTYATTATTATLNVNGTGAVSVYWQASSTTTNAWVAGEVCTFVYDGTYWVLIKQAKGATTWTDFSGACPISKGGTGSTTAAAALAALGGATMTLLTADVGTTWSANSSGGYMQTVSVTGILSTDVPVVGLVMSSDVAAATLQGKAFANVNRITTAAGSITLYAFTTAPTTAFTVQLLIVRAAA